MVNGKLFFDTYGNCADSYDVVEIGSQNVNGSLRDVCPKNVKYIGVDFVVGNGVDVVLTDPYSLPFYADSVDVVVSSSCFEHSEMFWLLFNEILRILKPNGLFYLNVPSNGHYHRYPVDCWRFYPDSGNALVTWGKRSGFNPALLEAYTSMQNQDVWNDYVAVFIKDAGHVHEFQDRMLSKVGGFYNGRLFGREELINPQGATQETMKLFAISGILNGSITVK